MTEWPLQDAKNKFSVLVNAALAVKGGGKTCHWGGVKVYLSHKFAVNRSRDDRCSIEMEIAANGVIPSGFWEWVMRGRRDCVPE